MHRSANGLDTRLRPRGSNHAGMRQFNERVVLQAIRLHGSLPKAEIARLTHLTAQTVQIIIARLEADDLVRKLDAGARQGRPAFGADGAEPGRRVLHRHQDRPAQHGHAAGRLQPARCASGCRWATPSPTPTRCSPRSTLRLAQLRKSLAGRAARAPARRRHRRAAVAGRLAGTAGHRAGAGGQVGGHRHPRARRGDDRPAGGVRQGHRGRLRGRTRGRPRAQHPQLPLRLRRHLHRRRPGARQPPARRRARQCRRGRLDAARPGTRRRAQPRRRSCSAWPRCSTSSRCTSRRAWTPRPPSTRARCSRPGSRRPRPGCATRRRRSR